MSRLTQPLSKLSSLPLLRYVSPPAALPTSQNAKGYLLCQTLAMQAANEVSRLMRPGWSERQAATLMDEYLQDHGVKAFFHRSFCWIGERTRFEGVKRYQDFLPTGRILRENEVYILDVAPILDGYIADIGYSAVMGEDAEFVNAMSFLASLKKEIPRLFEELRHGGSVWRSVDESIRSEGYDNIHSLYPFSVLGHRVHRVAGNKLPLHLINFGWQSYWALLSRGVFGQLLNQDYEGDVIGLWAIEPHIGTSRFGAKFEEILVVERERSYWLGDHDVQG